MMLEMPAFLFSGIGLFYGLTLPVAGALLFSFLLIPAIHVSGAKPLNVCKAIYCYALQALGIFFMSITGLLAIYGVLAGTVYSDSNTYLGLLLVFTTGGLLYVWHDTVARSVDAASRSVPHAVFVFTFRLVGMLISVFSILSLFLTMLLRPITADVVWWVQPVMFLFYGLILCWCTWEVPGDAGFKKTTLKAAGVPRKK